MCGLEDELDARQVEDLVSTAAQLHQLFKLRDALGQGDAGEVFAKISDVGAVISDKTVDTLGAHCEMFVG